MKIRMRAGQMDGRMYTKKVYWDCTALHVETEAKRKITGDISLVSVHL